jgi:superoxide dismutase, Fe-Mn family
MKYNFLVIGLLFITIISCKKNRLVEYVEVPATPIQITKVKGGTSNPADVKAAPGNFKLETFPHAYNSFEPHFDAATLEIHYSKHHLGYVNNLNKVIVNTKYEFMTLNDIFKNLNASNLEVRNNAGGVYNHNFFWEILTPNKTDEPEGVLMDAIVRDFGSFDEFRNTLVNQATQYFGSGWIWLVSDKTGKLKIMTTANNDNPLMKGLPSGIPLLNLDLWEHAYYLKFQNRKREYANTFFSLINWEVISKKYDAIPNKEVKSVIIEELPEVKEGTNEVNPEPVDIEEEVEKTN